MNLYHGIKILTELIFYQRFYDLRMNLVDRSQMLGLEK
jgi:hypothetical protein